MWEPGPVFPTAMCARWRTDFWRSLAKSVPKTSHANHFCISGSIFVYTVATEWLLLVHLLALKVLAVCLAFSIHTICCNTAHSFTFQGQKWFGEDGKLVALPDPLKETPDRPPIWEEMIPELETVYKKVGIVTASLALWFNLTGPHTDLVWHAHAVHSLKVLDINLLLLSISGHAQSARQSVYSASVSSTSSLSAGCRCEHCQLYSPSSIQ